MTDRGLVNPDFFEQVRTILRLQQFLLELGKGFSFVGRLHRA